MTPSLITHSGDVLPWSKIKLTTSAIVWNRDGHYRLIPEGRVRDFHRLMVSDQAYVDRPVPKGIAWVDTEPME